MPPPKKLNPVVQKAVNGAIKQSGTALSTDLAAEAKKHRDTGGYGMATLFEALSGAVASIVSGVPGEAPEASGPKPPKAASPRQKVPIVVDGKPGWAEVIPKDEE